MKYQFDDGGRLAAGFVGETRDCVCRAIAIATGKGYREVYDALNAEAGKAVARKGVGRKTYDAYLLSLGWKWTPTMKIGQGCKVHLADGELPCGRLIVMVSKHAVAVVDGVVRDNHDPSRGGSRCVYGYWSQ